MLITLYKIGEVHFRLLGTNGFHVKANERFTAASSRCRHNLKYENFTSSFCRLQYSASKHCTKKRAARAARLFFFIQTIKSLICGVVVDVPSSNLKLSINCCELWLSSKPQIGKFHVVVWETTSKNWRFRCRCRRHFFKFRELKQPRRRRQHKPHKFA